MKRLVEGAVEAGEGLASQAAEALRLFRQAKEAGAPAGEVERLRVIAESLFQAASEYQLRALGHDSPTLQ
ncbi:hypothetical protein ACX3YG_14200 [Pseudomonas wadenswilerensis]